MSYVARESEARYQRLAALGRAVDYAGRSFEDFDLRPWLDAVLPGVAHGGGRALELGTGTGAGACYLAARGWQVEGIDLAPTAIALARRFAAERGLSVTYRVGDACELAARDLDLVVDSFCLHRVIADSARAAVMANVRAALVPGGAYVIGCVVARAGRDYGDDRCDADGVVWRRVEGEWLPRARHVSPAALAAELARAGFRIVRQDGGRVRCALSASKRARSAP